MASLSQVPTIILNDVLYYFLDGFAQFSIELEFGREENTTFLPQIILLLGSRERERERCR
jgi:hypothetical protein